MVKRQDANHGLNFTALWHFLFILVPLFLAACQNQQPTVPTIPLPQNSPTIGEQSLPTLIPITPTLTSLAVITPPNATPTPDCLSLGGKLHKGSFQSTTLISDFNYLVYLPPCYQSNPDKHYPTIYLLHGLSYTNDQWLRLGLIDQMNTLIANGSVAPAIIVLPEESTPEAPQTSQFDDALLQELIPWIDSLYATHPDKAYRAIGGVSRGAAWAVRIGFENPDLFSRIGAHSLPLFETDGGRIFAWLTQIPPKDFPEVFIDIGRDDPEWQSAQTFADLLNENNIPHEWYLFKNGHTETYWSSHLEGYLRWYTRDW